MLCVCVRAYVCVHLDVEIFVNGHIPVLHVYVMGSIACNVGSGCTPTCALGPFDG